MMHLNIQVSLLHFLHRFLFKKFPRLGSHKYFIAKIKALCFCYLMVFVRSTTFDPLNGIHPLT
jgi:hypothetical protein